MIVFISTLYNLIFKEEKLAGTIADVDVFVLQGEKEGGSLLVLGGTHANEPAGHMAGIVLEENAKVEQGTIYVIPSINNSALTHRELGDFTETYTLLMETGNLGNYLM